MEKKWEERKIMKKTGRYFLALLLSFCMLCGQLLPAVQAFAIPVATPSGEDGQHVWEIADESSGYPADFEHGTILRYKYDDGRVLLVLP